MKKILSQVIAGIAGLWIASMFVPGVRVELLPDSSFFGINLTVAWQIFLVLGTALGLLNYFLRPILKILALPIAILTLGLFSFIINIAMIWLVDIAFREFTAPFFYPLLLTTLIIWAINIAVSIVIRE